MTSCIELPVNDVIVINLQCILLLIHLLVVVVPKTWNAPFDVYREVTLCKDSDEYSDVKASVVRRTGFHLNILEVNKN